MAHPQAPHGIRYNSRKNPARINYAVFGSNQAHTAVHVEQRYPLVDYPKLYRFLLLYDVTLL
jgi:hypothetical protein